ncbi:MAG: hypothetical protein LRZ84_23770 [Desertifilum sp.]|nr:hypothetical protein [Desertifilum sp.]
MSNFEEAIKGKNLITYAPKGGKQYSSKEIGQYLKQFELCYALRFIGDCSYELYERYQGFCVIDGVPIFDGVLAYLSMRLIENSNDYRSKKMDMKDLLKAIDMYFGLPDPFQEGSGNWQGCLMRFGSSQLDYDREARHLLPRTLLIYEELWNKLKSTTRVNVNIDINDAIKDIFKLNFKEILLLSLYFFKIAKNGFFRLEENIENYSSAIKLYLDINKQKALIKHISCNYQDFRLCLQKDNPPSSEYEKFRFNPLVSNPVIIPDRNLEPGYSQVYITPIPRLIYEKVTRGLYFTLENYFKENTRNQFTVEFGSVFQEYVGLLLTKAVGEDNVKPEWQYGPKKQRKDTPDWLVVLNDFAVLIEVKKSHLNLEAKKWSEVDEMQKYIKQNIGKGVNQMWKFEEDIRNGNCHLPENLKNINIVERLVVVYDRPYFANSIVRDEVRQSFPTINEEYHWHTISIEDLEYFLGVFGIKIIEALQEKRLDLEGDKMDFRDYCSRKVSKAELKNSYLDSVIEKFLHEEGIRQ